MFFHIMTVNNLPETTFQKPISVQCFKPKSNERSLFFFSHNAVVIKNDYFLFILIMPNLILFMSFTLISNNSGHFRKRACSGTMNSLGISENVHMGVFHLKLEVAHDITLDSFLGEQDTYLTIQIG